MFTTERFRTILDYLKVHQKATVEELTNVLYVSGATVRRDLTEMSKLGMLERTHGGALYLGASEEVSIYVRLEKNAKEKEFVASSALACLPDFNSVFIDNSSTCLALAERMNLAHKTILTNGLQVAMKLSQKTDIKIIVPGGEVFYNTHSVTGSLACRALKDFKVDLMLSSCAAFDENGAYEFSLDTAQIKQVAFEQSKIHFMIADRSKYNAIATYRAMPLNSYDKVVTNITKSQAETLQAKGINVVI